MQYRQASVATAALCCMCIMPAWAVQVCVPAAWPAAWLLSIIPVLGSTKHVSPLHAVCLFHVVQIPVALATSQPERRVKPAIERLNLSNYFDAIVTAEDNGSPEVSC